MNVLPFSANMKIRSKILVPFLVIFIGASLVGAVFFIKGLTRIMESGLQQQLQSDAQRIVDHIAHQEELIFSHAHHLVGVKKMADQTFDFHLSSTLQINEMQVLEAENIRLLGYVGKDFLSDEPLAPLIKLGLTGRRGAALVAVVEAGGSYVRLVGVVPVPDEREVNEVLLLETRIDSGYLRQLGMAAGRELVLFDRSGRPVVSTIAGLTNRDAKAGPSPALSVSGNDAGPAPGELATMTVGGELYHLFAAPLAVNFQTPGFLAVMDPVAPFEKKRNQLIAEAALFSVIILVLLGLTYLAVVRTITRPIRALEEAAKRMMRGEAPGELDIKSTDEVGTLARTFQQMSHVLQQRQEELGRTIEESRYQRKQMEIIMGTMADGVVVINEDYGVEYMNKAAEASFGRHSGGLCYEFFRNTDHPCSPCSIEEIIHKGKSPFHYTSKGVDGRSYEVIGQPLRDLDGKTKILSLRRDITERLSHFEQQQQLQNQLQQERLKAIHQVGVSIKHGINNALTAISCSLQLLKEEVRYSEEQAALFVMMDLEVRKIQEVVARIEEITEVVEVNYADEVTMIDLEASGKKEE